MNVRKTALSLLRDAEAGDKYIALTLDGYLSANPCDARDRALLSALVYGTVERRVTLDYYIDALAADPKKVGARLRQILRLGLYQLMYLDRIPPHAAVAETVALGKSPGERAFLNGILRGYLRRGAEIPLPTDPIERRAVETGFPAPIVRLFDANLGADADRALRALTAHPPMTLAVNTLRTTRDALFAALQAAGIAAAICADAPRGITLLQNLPYSALCDAVGEGNFFVQDEASQIAVTALAPRPGEVGADVCACPGSKSLHAALLMENRGKIHAFDLHASKLPLVTASAARLGVDILDTEARDARTPREDLLGKCDFVLCDVPCTGLGVMAKKPEIRFHDPDLYKTLAPLGGEILRASARYLRRGGRLLYSTCTLTRAENEDNYLGFLAENPAFAPLDFTVGAVASRGGYVTLLPDGRRDGFFIGMLQKTGD